MNKINWKEHYLIIEKLIIELQKVQEFHKAEYLQNYAAMAWNNLSDKEQDEIWSKRKNG